MKKLTIFIIVVLSILLCTISFAEEETYKVDLKVPESVTVKQDAGKVEILLTLGELTNIDTQTLSAGFEATLTYDKDVFTEVQVEELNGWDVDYINKIVATVDGKNIKANTPIAKLTFILAENVEPSTKTIEIGNIEFSDDSELDSKRKPFNLSSTIVIETASNLGGDTTTPPTEEQPQEQTKKATKSGEGEGQVKTITQGAKDDNTKASSALPKTGMKKALILVVIVALLGIISFIKYKKIEIK